MPKVTSIPLDSIAVRDRLRPADDARIEYLARSIDVRGLQKPIEVAKAKGSKSPYRLVAGLHRLSAVRQLGWTEIAAYVVDGNKTELAIIEIVENLEHEELPFLDRCLHAAALKRHLLEQHPEMRHGGDRKSAEFGDENQDATQATWFDMAAERLPYAARTLSRYATIGDAIDAEAIPALRQVEQARALNQLEQISRRPPDEQKRVVAALSREEAPAKSVGDAIREIGGAEKSEISEQEKILTSLTRLWAKADGKTKRAFSAHLKGEAGDE